MRKLLPVRPCMGWLKVPLIVAGQVVLGPIAGPVGFLVWWGVLVFALVWTRTVSAFLWAGFGFLFGYFIAALVASNRRA